MGIHLRDYHAGKEVPLGQGSFDLNGLATAVRQTGWSGWLIVEEDWPNGVKAGSGAVKLARQAVRRAFGI